MLTSRTVAIALMVVAVAGAPGRADLAPPATGDVAPRLGGPQEAQVVPSWWIRARRRRRWCSRASVTSGA